MCRLIFFIKLGNWLLFFKYIFFTFLSFPPGVYCMYIGIHHGVPQVFEALLYFLDSLFFLFLIINHLIDLSSSLLIVSSASLHLMLSLFNESFSFQLIVLFNYRISI